MPKIKTAQLLLRVALAFAFAYAAVAGFLNPSAWIGFAPVFVLEHIPGNIFLTAFGAFEVALAALLLFLKNPFYPALVAALLLFGMVAFNLGALDIVFRDLSLGFAALALATLSKS